jgi:predicted Rossmann fold flavoprotein
LQGQRINASARSIIEGRPGEPQKGELLFTKYGLSGTCILDISEEISIAINRRHQREVLVSVDMVPFMDAGQLRKELDQRLQRKPVPEDVLVGLLPNKLCVALKYLFEKNDISQALKTLKDRRFKVSDTRGWNEAEFTSGGVNVAEITPGTLESKIKKGVYFAGEVLDVNGRRGGYNLAWAWASGLASAQ